MAKIVIDANVLISAAFGGNPLRAVVRAMDENEVYISDAIERELIGVFSKLSKKLTRDQIAYLSERMREFLKIAKRVSVSSRVVLSRDPKDDHYLALCKEVEADFLITGDKDLLSIPSESLRKKGLTCRIITPQEFAEEV
jgi:putative PIN family toxin of toxin-antitoxin system